MKEAEAKEVFEGVEKTLDSALTLVATLEGAVASADRVIKVNDVQRIKGLVTDAKLQLQGVAAELSEDVGVKFKKEEEAKKSEADKKADGDKLGLDNAPDVAPQSRFNEAPEGSAFAPSPDKEGGQGKFPAR